MGNGKWLPCSTCTGRYITSKKPVVHLIFVQKIIDGGWTSQEKEKGFPLDVWLVVLAVGGSWSLEEVPIIGGGRHLVIFQKKWVLPTRSILLPHFFPKNNRFFSTPTGCASGLGFYQRLTAYAIVDGGSLGTTVGHDPHRFSPKTIRNWSRFS